MLILSRKVGESIMIGDNVSIMLVDIKNRQIKLGIDAPAETSVHRKEIYEKIQKDKEEKCKEIQR